MMKRALGLAAFAALSLGTTSLSAQPLIEPQALIEGDARLYSSAAEGFDGFVLRRVRLGARMRPTARIDARVVAELASATPRILDAFVSFRPVPTLEINAGFFRLSSMLTGRDERVFASAVPERAMVVTALWPNRDLGVEVHWVPVRVPLEAWVRIGNGSGNPLAPEISAPSFLARLDFVLGRGGVYASREATYGLRVGAAVLTSLAPDRNGIAGVTPLGFTFFRPVPIEGRRVTVTGHVRGYLGPVQVTVEGGLNRDARSRDVDGDPLTPREVLPSIDTYGVTGEVAWMVTGHRRQSGEWPFYDRAGQRFGAWEVAVRAERLSLAQNASDVTSGGVTGGAVAVRWWINRWAGMALAGYLNRYDRAPLEAPGSTSSNAFLLRGILRMP